MKTTQFLLFALAVLMLGCQKDNLTLTENPQDSGIDFRAAEKLLVCHNTGSETNPWELIEVAEPAYKKAHLVHGDAQPGDAIPGMDGYKFGCNCEEVAVTISAGDDQVQTGQEFTGYRRRTYGWYRRMECC